MVKLQWAVKRQPEFRWFNICQRCKQLKTTIKSLFYNHHLSWNYVCDILLEPILWFVENFTGVLGPIFVVMTIVLTTLIVYIAYYVGFPWWWEKSPAFTIFLVIFGNWILVNVCFHYYMGVQVLAGYPPKGGLIPEAVSICKKCIEPKPPRTHHCSVCNRCILKMDHHCPWLNNCVGHYNHRYFFQYMAFTVAGCVFIMIFGVRLAYEEFFLSPEPEPEGHPVRLQNSQYVAVPEILDDLSSEERKDIAKKATETAETDYKRKLIILAGLLCVGTFLALGGLTLWHMNLISKGETSVEGRINSTLRKKFKDQGKSYINPYNFGKKENWILFLGLRGRNWRHILFPSTHKPYGTGLSWQTVNNDKLS